MKYQMLPRLTSMLLIWALLLGWQISAPHLGDVGIALFLFLLVAPVTMSGAEVAFGRRYAFRSEYLTGEGWISRLMGLEPVVFAVEFGKALVLTLVLMTFALSLDLHGWAVLLLDVLILSLLMPRLPGLLAASVKPTYLFLLARRWAIQFNTLLLWLESMAVLLLRGGGDYRGLAWAEVLRYSMPDGQLQADGVVDAMLRIYAGAEGLTLWTLWVLGDSTAEPARRIAAALLLIAAACIWYLIALAVSRALIGTLARPLAIWRPRPQRRAGGGVFETWWL